MEQRLKIDLQTFVNKTQQRFEPSDVIKYLKKGFRHLIQFAKFITIWKAYNRSSEWYKQ